MVEYILEGRLQTLDSSKSFIYGESLVYGEQRMHISDLNGNIVVSSHNYINMAIITKDSLCFTESNCDNIIFEVKHTFESYNLDEILPIIICTFHTYKIMKEILEK